MYKDPEMVNKMKYRANFEPSAPRHNPPAPGCSRCRDTTGLGLPNTCYCPSHINDIFDGSHYRSLRDTAVTVNGKVYAHRFFGDSRDIALGFSTDGFTPFKRGKQTCWPLILYNMNLPPEERFHKDNIICVGVIPGPKKPHDPDSFLWALVEELLMLAIGIAVFDVTLAAMFLLRVFLIILGGDIPAMTMIMHMKGHNAYSSCRMCNIHGVQIPDSTAKVYYIPLDRSRHPSVMRGDNEPACYDPLALPLRTHEEFISQANEVETRHVQAEANRLAKLYGIKGRPILSALASLAFPTSVPFDFMHLLWENTLPNLVQLWTGEFKGLDEGCEEYQLDPHDWEAVGKATKETGATIPSSFGPRLPNINDERMYYTADMWSFWTLHVAPVLLKWKFKHVKYYDHFLQLVRLLHKCLQFEFTPQDVSEIRIGFAKWVQKYEQ